MNEDYSKALPIDLGPFSRSADADVRPLVDIVEGMEHSLLHSHGYHSVSDLPPGKWFHLWLLSVKKDYRQRGIGKKLTDLSLALGKIKGFELFFAVTTSTYSTRLGNHVQGSKVHHYVDYLDWEFEGKKQYNSLPDTGHRGVSLLVYEYKHK